MDTDYLRDLADLTLRFLHVVAGRAPQPSGHGSCGTGELKSLLTRVRGVANAHLDHARILQKNLK